MTELHNYEVCMWIQTQPCHRSSSLCPFLLLLWYKQWLCYLETFWHLHTAWGQLAFPVPEVCTLCTQRNTSGLPKTFPQNPPGQACTSKGVGSRGSEPRRILKNMEEQHKEEMLTCSVALMGKQRSNDSYPHEDELWRAASWFKFIIILRSTVLCYDIQPQPQPAEVFTKLLLTAFASTCHRLLDSHTTNVQYYL